MRLSRAFLPTLKETPAEAQIASHRLMLRAGLIRRLAADIRPDVVHAHYLLPYGHWAAEADVHPLVMSPWNTDIFTYGKERERGRRWVAQSIAAGDRFVVSSLGNTDETVRLGADPAQIVVERAMYSSANGVVWSAGTNALATRLQ